MSWSGESGSRPPRRDCGRRWRRLALALGMLAGCSVRSLPPPRLTCPPEPTPGAVIARLDRDEPPYLRGTRSLRTPGGEPILVLTELGQQEVLDLLRDALHYRLAYRECRAAVETR